MSTQSPVATESTTKDPAPNGGLVSIIAFLALFVLGALINSLLSDGGPYPVPTDSPEDVLRWRTDNASTVRITGAVGALAGLALIWHASWLASVVRTRTGNGHAAQLMFGGGVISGVFLMFGSMLQWIIESPETLADVSLMRAVDRLIYMTTGPGSVVGFTFLVGVGSLVLLGTDLIPRWLSIVGVVAGALAVLSLVMLLPEGGEMFAVVSLGRFPSLLWLLVSAVLLNRRLRAAG